MLITKKFCASRSTGVSRNMANGACLNLIATSVRLDLSAFSSAEIEGNTRPTPIVDHELECDVGFGCAVWSHIGRSTVILDFVVSHPRRQILRAHRVSQRIRLARYMHRIESFRLFRADRVRLETRGWLHGHER